MNFSPWHFTSSLLTRDEAEAGRVSHPRAAPPRPSSPIQTLLSYSGSSNFHYAHLVVVSKFCPRGTFPEVQPGPGLPKREPERRAPNRLKNSWSKFWRRSKRPKIHCPFRRSPPSTPRPRAGGATSPSLALSSKKRKADFPDAEH